MGKLNLPIFVVSLVDSKRRIEISKKLGNMEFEFIDAIYGKDFPNELTNVNSSAWVQSRYSRNLTPGEYGCTMSHRFIYQKMINDNLEWAIILEDDVDFDFNFQKQLTEIINNLDKKNLYLMGCQEGLSSFDHVVLSKKDIIHYKDIKFYRTLHSEKYLYRTAAYLISKNAATNIINYTKDNFCLADDWSTYSRNHLFDNIFLGNFISHPEVLEGQSTIEGERLLESNLSGFRKSRLFFFLRNIKKNLRQVIIKFFYDI